MCDCGGSVDWREEIFERVFVRLRAKELLGGFWRGIVELAALDAAEVARVADAGADVDGGRFERDVSALSERLPAVGTFKLHFPTLTLKSGTPPPQVNGSPVLLFTPSQC